MNKTTYGPEFDKDPWFQSLRGRAVSIFNPTVDDIDPAELSILLARVNRFGGHTKKPLTVATHSVNVSRRCPKRKLAGLLHDATEGYLGCDITRPLKTALGSIALRKITKAWDKVIGQRFGIDPKWFHCKEVKAADNYVLEMERRLCMAKCDVEWCIPLDTKYNDTIPFMLFDECDPWVSAVSFAGHLSDLTGEDILDDTIKEAF